MSVPFEPSNLILRYSYENTLYILYTHICFYATCFLIFNPFALPSIVNRLTLHIVLVNALRDIFSIYEYLNHDCKSPLFPVFIPAGSEPGGRAYESI